jgi:hypothetical protein
MSPPNDPAAEVRDDSPQSGNPINSKDSSQNINLDLAQEMRMGFAEVKQEMRLEFTKVEAKIENRFTELKGDIKAIDVKFEERVNAIKQGLEDLKKRLDTNEAIRSRLITGLVGVVIGAFFTIVTRKIFPGVGI